MNPTLKLRKPTIFTVKFLLSAVSIFAGTQLIFNWFQRLILSETNKIKDYTGFLFVSYSSSIILLAIVPTTILISWSLSRQFFPYLKRLKITPLRFWCILHGAVLGGLISVAYWYGTNTDLYQKVWIFQLDFILIPVVVGCLLDICQHYFQPMKRKESDVFSLLKEAPITNPTEDRLNNESVINELEQALTIGDIDSKVIALYGSNGIGKTSILNILENRFSKDKSYRFVQFEPYQYRDEKEIIKGFYGTLMKPITQSGVFPGLKGLPERFLKRFGGISAKLSFIDVNFENLSYDQLNDDGYQDLKETLTRYIDELDIKVIMVIDDLDRCSIRKRYLLFQLLNTVGKIKNISFIISASAEELLSAYDPTMVSLVE